MKAIAWGLLLAALVAGCARPRPMDPNAAPPYNDRTSCEAAGGKWKATTQHCDRD